MILKNIFAGKIGEKINASNAYFGKNYIVKLAFKKTPYVLPKIGENRQKL
jgi:hypothetical protein